MHLLTVVNAVYRCAPNVHCLNSVSVQENNLVSEDQPFEEHSYAAQP